VADVNDVYQDTGDYQEAGGEDAFKNITVYHAVYRKEQEDIFKTGKIKQEYGSLYVMSNPETVLRSSGYKSNPLIIWSWSTRGDGTPTSPSWDALPAFIKLNSISKDLLKASQMSVDPPLNVPSELAGQLKWRPRSILPYTASGRTVSPANVGINYPIGKEREEAMIQMIREHFFIDFFLLMASLSGKGKLTATQVLEMQGEKAGILGSIIAGMNKEYLDPIFDRLFDLNVENNWFPPEVAQFKGNLRIDYEGLLAQAQPKVLCLKE